MKQLSKKQQDHIRALSVLNSVVADNIHCFDDCWEEFNQQTKYKTFHAFIVARQWKKILIP